MLILPTTPAGANSNGGKPPDHLLGLDEAEGRLNPHLKKLDECIQHGWDTWKTFYQPKHHILDARSRAAIVFQEIVARAEQVFAGVPGVECKRTRNNSFMIYIGDDISLRFKKLNKNGRCSNIDTKQQMLFSAQMHLVGMSPGTLVNAGYMLTDLQQDLQQKLIVCQFQNQVLWTIKLGKKTETLQFTPAPTIIDKPQSPRFEVKDSGKKDEKKKGKAAKAGDYSKS